MTSINIYTDGGCRCNPGIGAYAFVILNDKENYVIHEDSKFKVYTTNNEMELLAMYASLDWIHNELISGADPVDLIKIYSDSAYAIGCVRDWGPNWINQGIISQKSNSELVLRLCNLTKEFRDKFQCDIEFVKVKGHNGNKWNEYVDQRLNDCMNYNLTKDPDVVINGQSYSFLASIHDPIDTVTNGVSKSITQPGYYRIKFSPACDGYSIIVKLVTAVLIQNVIYITCVDKENVPMIFRYSDVGWDFVDPDYYKINMKILERYNCELWNR